MTEIIKKYIKPFSARGKAFFMPDCRAQAAACGAADKLIGIIGVIQKTPCLRAVQKCSDARRAKTEPRGVYGYTLSGAVCSATQQMSVFQQLFRSRN